MDTAFAKIVTGPNGQDCILIDGQVIALNVPHAHNDEFVDAIVRGLRNQCGRTSSISHATSTD